MVASAVPGFPPLSSCTGNLISPVILTPAPPMWSPLQPRSSHVHPSRGWGVSAAIMVPLSSLGASGSGIGSGILRGLQ